MKSRQYLVSLSFAGEITSVSLTALLMFSFHMPLLSVRMQRRVVLEEEFKVVKREIVNGMVLVSEFEAFGVHRHMYRATDGYEIEEFAEGYPEKFIP